LQDFKINPTDSTYISEAKLDQTHNTLVFRTIDTNFFWVQNVATGIQPLVQPQPFKPIPRF